MSTRALIAALPASIHTVLPDDGVLVAGGVTDQDDTLGVGRGCPGVVTGARGEGPGGCPGHDLLTPRVGGQVAGGEEVVDPAWLGEAVLVGQPGRDVGAGAAGALVEQHE